MDRYPESDLTDDAQFYVADSFLSKKDYQRARVEFDKVLSVSQSYRPQALLKRAYALQGTRQAEDQKVTLKTLIKEFPDSSEAQTAEQILKEISKPAPPKKSKSPQE